MAKVVAKKKIQFWGTGRRKHSIARVRLVPGNGSVTINDRTMDEYFGGLDTLKLIVNQPLELTATTDKFDVFVFTDMLLSRITKAWASVQTQDTKLVDAYVLTSDLKRNLAIKNTDSKALFEKYLLELRKIMRGSLL